MPRSQRITRSLPSLSTYSAAISSSSSVAREPALEQHRAGRSARSRSAARSSACCGRRPGSTSATSATSSTSRTSISSVTIGRPVRSFASLQEPQALLAEALERVGRACAACRRHHAASSAPVGGDDVGDLRASARGSRPCTGPAISAKLPSPTAWPRRLDDGALALAELRRGELVGLSRWPRASSRSSWLLGAFLWSLLSVYDPGRAGRRSAGSDWASGGCVS